MVYTDTSAACRGQDWEAEAKMKEMEKKGASNYDIDDIKLSDDEKEGDYFERMAEERLRKAKDFQDDPYKAKEDEKLNFEK